MGLDPQEHSQREYRRNRLSRCRGIMRATSNAQASDVSEQVSETSNTSGPNIRIENIVGNYEINELGDAPAPDVAVLDDDSEENNAFIAFNPSVFANLLNEEISDSPNRFTLLGRELSHIGNRTVSLVNDLHCGSIEPNGDSNKGRDLRSARIL